MHLSAAGVEEVTACAARRNVPITYTLRTVKEGEPFDFGDRQVEVIAGTNTVVPTGDGPNYAFPVQPNQVRYRENFAAIIYTKPVQK